jgi:hypothetical protein
MEIDSAYIVPRTLRRSRLLLIAGILSLLMLLSASGQPMLVAGSRADGQIWMSTSVPFTVTVNQTRTVMRICKRFAHLKIQVLLSSGI